LKIFVDTCILYDIIGKQEGQVETVLNHCKNKGFQIATSISTIGEFVNTAIQSGRDNLIHRLPGFLREYCITVVYPSHYFPETLMTIEGMDASYRLSDSDKLHLAFAHYGECDFFFTSDKDLRDSNAYENLVEIGYYGKLRKYL